ncbi:MULTISPECIES: MFS transporter [unclassified Streptomyces]|uniref:MFS transporter n=1 Tax=unclassified Streptomyces TaxID=2593676 RepID=UPI00343762CB
MRTAGRQTSEPSVAPAPTPGPGPFGLIWAGHLLSLVGSSVLRFGLVVQAWGEGRQATDVVVLSLCALLPQIAFSPMAGALVDRLPKRRALQLADLGGLSSVTVLAVAHALGALDLWLVYVAVAGMGTAAAFQYPALSSAVVVLVGEDRLQRANGLLSSAKNSADLGGPVLGGALVAFSGLGVLIWIDMASYVLALAAVQYARFTEPARPPAGPARPGRLFAEAGAGVRELWRLPSLRDLTLVFFVVNLVMMLGFAAVQPMVLARTNSSISALAAVNTCIGVGGVAGGLLLAAWGGPRNRVRGMMLGIIGMCLSAQVAMALADTVPGWCLSILVGALLMPVVNSAMQSVIQAKVPQELQGRVFGAVMFVSQISVPVAMAASGPLVDHVFEPQAAAHSGFVHLLAPLVGQGRGSGMAALLLLAGVCGTAAALWGLSRRTLRDIDTLLPDLVADPAK